MIYGITPTGRAWHILYAEEDDQPALCGIGALKRQEWVRVQDYLPEDSWLVCANCERVNERGNPR